MWEQVRCAIGVPVIGGLGGALQISLEADEGITLEVYGVITLGAGGGACWLLF